MEVSDWINIIAAILVGGGTLFLGIMAWRTIRQTRSTQKAEKRERLLDEIIQWAIDTYNISFGTSFLPEEMSLEERHRKFLRCGNKLLRYQAAFAKNEYMKKTANIFEEELPTRVLEFTKRINNIRNVLVERITKNIEDEDLSKKQGKYEHLLSGSAIKLIKVATDIKTRYLQIEGKT